MTLMFFCNWVFRTVSTPAGNLFEADANLLRTFRAGDRTLLDWVDNEIRTDGPVTVLPSVVLNSTAAHN